MFSFVFMYEYVLLFWRHLRRWRYIRKRHYLLTFIVHLYYFSSHPRPRLYGKFHFSILPNICCPVVAPTLTLKSRGVSISWISEYAEFPFAHCQITRRVQLTWISEVANFLSWFLAGWVSLSWICEYAEFHSPESLGTLSYPALTVRSRDVSYSSESLKSPSFFHDCWHAEFHPPECLST